MLRAGAAVGAAHGQIDSADRSVAHCNATPARSFMLGPLWQPLLVQSSAFRAGMSRRLDQTSAQIVIKVGTDN